MNCFETQCKCLPRRTRSSQILNTTVKDVFTVRGDADKSLARPGRKQATATKLGIYSTHSPRSIIHFFARCSNFWKPFKKIFRKLSVQTGLRGSNDLRVGWKMATFQSFFSVQGTGGSPRGPGPENRVGDQGQFLLGCQCPVRRDIVVQEQHPLGELAAAFFLQNALQLQQQR